MSSVKCDPNNKHVNGAFMSSSSIRVVVAASPCLLVALFICCSCLCCAPGAADLPADILKHVPLPTHADLQEGQRRGRQLSPSFAGGGRARGGGGDGLQSMFASHNLAAERYCADDVAKQCRAGAGDGSSGSGGGDVASSKFRTATECLESLAASKQIGSAICARFIAGRRACLRDMAAVADCKDLQPSVELTDRHNQRRVSIESRRARMVLRRQLTTAGGGGGGGGGDGGRSVKNEEQEQAATPHQPHPIEASPSMSVYDDVLVERQLREHDAKLDADKRDAAQSSERNDLFLAVCAAHLQSADRLSAECRESDVAGHLPFRDAAVRAMAERKLAIHRHSLQRLDADRAAQKRMLDTLRDRTTRHEIDRMEEREAAAVMSPESATAAAGAGTGDDAAAANSPRAAFLMRERRERERRRRLHSNRAQEKFSKGRRGGGGGGGGARGQPDADPFAAAAATRSDEDAPGERSSSSDTVGSGDPLSS